MIDAEGYLIVWVRTNQEGDKWTAVYTTWDEVFIWLRRGYDVTAEKPLKCEYPGCRTSPTRHWPSMTMYVNDQGEYDPAKNPEPVLCNKHGEEYVDYWNEMWAEYRSSQGF